MSSTTSSQLPDARLVVTGHAPDGTSIFTFDDTRKPFAAPFGAKGSTFTSFHASPTVPVSNTAPYPELAAVLPGCAPEGVIFCSVDIPAGGSAPMHRTLSIDYAVVLSGEIVLSLDGGEEKNDQDGRRYGPARGEPRMVQSHSGTVPHFGSHGWGRESCACGWEGARGDGG
ncbi:hypothetical protein B0H16DRAFT_557429 [Mycena metata]|uniref:Uncharacterized protein n=1 Tax=Mycena metata TaxID=1033252 RepID=A0AAD7JAY5_9AGAR|nr:hypothetical protein B0H16DRAFT_557429 [Mycena metata]